MKESIALPIFQPQTENPCFTCGECCKNILFYGDRKEILDRFPGPKSHVPDTDTLLNLQYISSKDCVFPAIYFTEVNEDRVNFLIPNKCPFQLSDNRCGDYENRFEACRKLEVGSDACNKAREYAKLPPVLSDGTIIQVEKGTKRQRIKKVIKKISFSLF